MYTQGVAGNSSDGKEKHVIENWRKGIRVYSGRKLTSMSWFLHLCGKQTINEELGDLAEEISKKKFEYVSCSFVCLFFLCL